MPPVLLTEYKDNTLCLTLNRAKQKNALSYTLLEELQAALNSEIQAGCRAVIISGGSDCFSAGADLYDLTGTIEDIEMDVAISKVTDGINNAPIPVIALIRGACIGGAVDVALACDLRIATHNAWFQVPAARLGHLYNPDAVARLSRIFPRDTLIRLLALGERFDAAAALQAGLVTHLVDEQDASPKIAELVRQAATNVPRAVADTKGLLNALYGGQYDPAHWQAVRKEILTSAERREAIARAKRKKP